MFGSNKSKSVLKSNWEASIDAAGVICEARVSLLLNGINSCEFGFTCTDDAFLLIKL